MLWDLLAGSKTIRGALKMTDYERKILKSLVIFVNELVYLAQCQGASFDHILNNPDVAEEYKDLLK